ncbi:MAG: hypothetical protein GEU83_08525 [Pseudonocardiaceae bacterium]|nr:hypothetical protein [Pseudonocardiaceae bacterium]
MPLSTTDNLTRQTRPLRAHLRGDEPLTKAQRWALEDFVLKVASLAASTGHYSDGGTDVVGKMIGEDVTELIRAAGIEPPAAAQNPILCAHADGSADPRWKAPGQPCDRQGGTR